MLRADLIASDTAEHGVDWAEYAECAKLAKSLDFGCDFGPNGCAIGHPRNCCADCSSSYGYLRVIPKEAVETVKALFDKETGFWTPSGCVLPVEYRSPTCLSFYCDCALKSEDYPAIVAVSRMMSGSKKAKETIVAHLAKKAAFAV